MMDTNSFQSLDMSDGEFRQLGYRVIDLISEYYASIREVPVFSPIASEKLQEVYQEPLPLHGQEANHIINEWEEKVLPYVTHLGSPRYFGFVNGSGTMIGVLAEALAASVNMNPGGWKAAPPATEIERRTISWIAELIGYDTSCGGLFTTGGHDGQFYGAANGFAEYGPLRYNEKWSPERKFQGQVQGLYV